MEHVAIDLDELPTPPDTTSSSVTDSESDVESRDHHVHVSRRDSILLFREAAQELADESKAFMEAKKMTTDFEAAAQGEVFDLRTYFQDSYSTRLSHGGKPKRMGVSVKNLTVVGQAPESSVISTNLTPLKYLFNVFNPNWWYVSLLLPFLVSPSCSPLPFPFPLSKTQPNSF